MSMETAKITTSVDEEDAMSGEAERKVMTKDEYHLATLGYRQVFIRSFSFIENWAATVNTMNFVNALPILFGFAMTTGGPQAAFANW